MNKTNGLNIDFDKVVLAMVDSMEQLHNELLEKGCNKEQIQRIDIDCSAAMSIVGAGIRAYHEQLLSALSEWHQ